MVASKTPANVDEYLTSLPDDVGAALQRLREIIRETVPESRECIVYKVPIIRLKKDFVGFASHKSFCSFYTMSLPLMARLKKELEPYDISGTTIHFQPNKPLPKKLVVKILKERLKEVQKESRKR